MNSVSLEDVDLSSVSDLGSKNRTCFLDLLGSKQLGQNLKMSMSVPEIIKVPF